MRMIIAVVVECGDLYNFVKMAFGLQFMHLVRLSIMPIIYYKIKQVQKVAPAEHEEGQGEGHAAH